MEISSAFMDSGSEEDEHSPNNLRINEIIAKARDEQRKQKPLLRERINIEDDIRKNYRRSIVRRAMLSNAVTSTPYASSARQPHLNISSILDLLTGGEDDNKMKTVQNANSSSRAKVAIKDGSAEERNNPDKETPILNESGLQLIEDNFRSPLPRYSTLATTSGLNRIKKTKPCPFKEKQRNDTEAVENSLLRRNSVHLNGSGVALDYKCSKRDTSKQDQMQTETKDDVSINGDIEYRKENVPYLSDNRHMCLRTGEYSKKSKVGDNSKLDTCRQKDKFHHESLKKLTREPKKYTKQSNPVSDSIIHRFHNKAKNKMKRKRTFYDFTEDSDDSDQSLVRHKDYKSHKLSMKEKIMRGRSSKYHNQNDISGNSSNEEIFLKKKMIDHGYRKKEKRLTEANLENNRVTAKQHKKRKSNFSIERFIQPDDNSNDVSSGSMSSALHTTISENFQKVPVISYRKRSIIEGASKCRNQSEIFMSNRDNKRFHKKGDQKKVEALKHDKYSSKHKRETNIIHESDMESKQSAKNRKTNVFKKTKSFPKKKHDPPVNISMSSSFAECDQSCVSKDSSESSSSANKNIYLHNQENQKKSHCQLKYRGKSIPPKIQSRSAKSSYYRKHNTTDLKEEENDVTTDENNRDEDKYFRLSKMRNNELIIKRNIPSGKAYKKYEKPNEVIGNNISSNVNSQNGDLNSFFSLPKKSLQALVDNLLIKGQQKLKTSQRDAPFKTKKNILLQGQEQDRLPELNFLWNTLFSNPESYVDDVSFNFGHSETPSIMSNSETSPPQKIPIKSFARKPFTKLNNDRISKSIEFRSPDFHFFKKKTCFGNKIVRKLNKCGLFQRFKCSDKQDDNCLPLTGPSQNWNCRKSISSSERIAIKAKLDEILGYNKDHCNKEKIIHEEQKMLDSVPQISICSQTSFKNSKVHNSTIEKHNQSLNINSANKLSQMKKCKLSVGTQYSPFINDDTEKDCLPVKSYNVSTDTHNKIQNNFEVDRDVGHSRNLRSSNTKNISTNTSFNTKKIVNRKFIKSRTVLTFDEDMESNRDMDLISPIVFESKSPIEFHENGASECSYEDFGPHTLKNDFLIDSDGFKNTDQTEIELNQNKILKQGENISSTPSSGPIQLLVGSGRINTEKEKKSLSVLSKRNEEQENNYSQKDLSNGFTNTDQTEIELNQNKILKQGDNISSTPSSGPIQLLVGSGRINTEKEKKSLSVLRKRNEEQENNYSQKDLSNGFTNMDQSEIELNQNKILKQGENISSTPSSGSIQLLVGSGRINTEKEKKSSSVLRKRNEEQENNYSQKDLSTSFTNNGNHTVNDETKIKVLHNITLKKRRVSGLSVKERNSTTKSLTNSKSIQGKQENTNIGFANNTRREPFVYIERMSSAEMKEASVKSSKKSKGTGAKEKNANVDHASDVQVLANFEGVRKSTRNRRPPQVIWWKSSIVEEGTDLIQYYERCQKSKRTRKGSNQSESDKASSVVRSKGTSFKKGNENKNNKKKDIPNREALSPSISKRINGSNKTETSVEKPSTSKGTGEELAWPGDYSIKNIPLGDKKDNLSCSNTILISENSDDPGYVTSSTRQEQEIFFKELCKNIQTNDNESNVHVFLELGEALSLENNFGYLVMKPEETKQTVNLKYDMIYCIVNGTCVFRTDYENSIKRPKDIIIIKRETPYQIRNSESKLLLMVFAIFS